MKKLFFLLAAIFAAPVARAQHFTINVHLTGFKNGTKFQVENADNQIIVDSSEIKNDQMTLKGQLSATPASLFVQGQADNQLYWFFVFIGNENVQVKGDRKDMPFKLHVTGSRSQAEYDILNKQIADYQTQRNALTYQIFPLMSNKSDSSEAAQHTLWTQVLKLDSLMGIIRQRFMREHFNTYAGLNEIFFARKGYSSDTLQWMLDHLSPEIRQSVFAQRIANYLSVGDELKNGDKYVDFTAQDTTGRQHQLSELKGKYLLIDFTETWCGPCMSSMKELKEIHQAYADSLQLLSFCADISKEQWLTGINRDKYPWLSLWDGEGYYGKTILKYGVLGYPTFVLINPAGNIIKKWTGYDDGGIRSVLEKEMK